MEHGAPASNASKEGALLSLYRVTGFIHLPCCNKAYACGYEPNAYRRANRGCLPVIISSLLFLFCILPATASGESCAPETISATNAGTATGQAAQRAVLDPATGQLDSSRQVPQRDFQALADSRTRLRQNIIVMEHPDGSKSADVGAAYLTTLEARIVDGELVTCHERRSARE